MVTNQMMVAKTANILANLLKKHGIGVTPYDTTLRPIEKVLRDSWYVDKAKQAGHTDCVYIGIECGGFFVVLEDCSIMVGKNIMIADAITAIIEDYTDFSKNSDIIDVWSLFRWHGWCDEPFCEDYVAFFEISQFRLLVEKLNFICEK